MIDSNLITTAEFASFAPEVDTSKFDVPTISGLIAAASKQVSNYLQYTPLAEDIALENTDARIDVQGDLVVFPRKIPLISLTSLALMKGSVTISIQLQTSAGVNRWNMDFSKTYFRYPYGELTLQGVPIFADLYSLRGTQLFSQISYRGGFEVSALPQAIKEATVLMTKDILSTQYNQTGATSVHQGGISFSFGVGAESRLTMLAKKMLGPYRRIG